MFDVHVHGGPDVQPRWGGDLDVVRRYADAGFRGCVLKGHYESTVGRAALADQAVPGIRVYGGLALNQHVGGFNPAAVAAALSAGGRVIWMPTTDAHTQRRAGLPRLCGVQTGLSNHTYAAPPVDESTREAIESILDLIAAADAVLATGHLSGPESAWLVAAATERGIGRILLTHPSYTVPNIPAVWATELAERGAHVEITAFQLWHQPGLTRPALAEFVKAIPPERLVLSSDAGQVDSPPPPDALRALIDALVDEGLDRGAMEAAASDIPEALVVS